MLDNGSITDEIGLCGLVKAATIELYASFIIQPAAQSVLPGERVGGSVKKLIEWHKVDSIETSLLGVTALLYHISSFQYLSFFFDSYLDQVTFKLR